MNRFKFRVWDINTKTMRSVWAITPFGVVVNDLKTENCKIPLNDCIIMQCTGLEDKDGKLIYEGDILNVFVDSIKPHYMPFVVIWDRKEWQLAQQNKNYKKCENCANRNKTKCSYCKEYFMSTGHTNFKDFYNGFIIGNIHENPELLEKRKC